MLLEKLLGTEVGGILGCRKVENLIEFFKGLVHQGDLVRCERIDVAVENDWFSGGLQFG